MCQVEATYRAGIRFDMPCHILVVFACACVLSDEKVLYHSVFDLFPLTYMGVDIDSRLFSD